MSNKKILYLASVCSECKYKKMFNKYKTTISHAGQKYHHLMVRGLVGNGYDVDVLSKRYINKRITRQIFFKGETEVIDNIKYKYLPVINIQLMSYIMNTVLAVFEILKWCVKNKGGIIICDILEGEFSIASTIATIFTKTKKIAIVTDVPVKQSNVCPSYYRKLTSNIKNMFINYFDGYIFLTEYMNDILNPHDKPYVVIEGHVDVNMGTVDNDLRKKYKKKICMMAGALDRVFGIELLVKAFIKANIENSELHIYGMGNYENDLRDICNINPKVKYFGQALNSVIVDEEIKATLLVNPRPSDKEYTKYSFPSKNMEYMVSGTPLLTTKLAGMPEDYYPYVYLIEEETIDSLAKQLKYLLSLPAEQLHEKGKSAKDFVLAEKNNIIKTYKIIKLIEEKL